MGMDKEISPEVKRRRKKILIIKFAFVACALVCFFIVLVKVFSAGIPLEDIDFGTVTKGEIGISVSATGKVAPCDLRHDRRHRFLRKYWKYIKNPERNYPKMILF